MIACAPTVPEDFGIVTGNATVDPNLKTIKVAPKRTQKSLFLGGGQPESGSKVTSFEDSIFEKAHVCRF